MNYVDTTYIRTVFDEAVADNEGNTATVELLKAVEEQILSRAESVNGVDTQNLIETFRDMAHRGTLLTGGNVSQDDLCMQIEGTIVKTAMNEEFGIKAIGE